ncbi:hypothetical protein AN958_07210 [Leucoagaricus sp. SymC.cos]|nr:hypothetical protein AN958_07210 [Leucoagaricus sp. SymC.cos]
MSSGPTEASAGVVRDVCVFSQNVNRNYAYLDMLLENIKDFFDIIFLQELPWRTIRQIVSMTSSEGDDVIGAPKHPDWLYMVGTPTNSHPPHIMAYVYQHLAHLHLSIWWDIIDYWDIFVFSLFTLKGVVNLLNVYSDDAHTTINFLSQEVNILPAFIYMGSDFNCHSEVWNSSHTSYPLVVQYLLEFTSDIRLKWAHPSNLGLTHVPHNSDLAGSMIDLVFTGPLSAQSDLLRLDLNHCGPSDHVPISTLIPISESEIRVSY